MPVFEALSQGDQEIRLAENEQELRAAQALRYRVFYEERGARPSPEMVKEKLDVDAFDEFADHLLVIDRSRGEGVAGVVGTYRLLRRDAADRIGTFYSASEFDITAIEAHPGECLELGRSCVDEAYRTKSTMQLLWRGIAAYIFHYKISLMFGCASFHGIDPQDYALPLSYLRHYHLAPPHLRPKAHPDVYVSMDMMPADQISQTQGLALVPPLLKGYLRLGGFVGDGAVIDHQFNTIDVCVIVKTDLVSDKYYKHYDRTAR